MLLKRSMRIKSKIEIIEIVIVLLLDVLFLIDWFFREIDKCIR